MADYNPPADVVSIINVVNTQLKPYGLCAIIKPIATLIKLELPTVTKEGFPMPNYEICNDWISTISIKTTNAGGQVEPLPAGDTFSVSCSNPAALQAAIGTDASGNPALVLTPLVQNSSGIAVTISDSAGLTQCVQMVDIVSDVTDTNIVLDLADATHISQPVPSTLSAHKLK